MSHICYTFVALKSKGTCVLAIATINGEDVLKDPGID